MSGNSQIPEVPGVLRSLCVIFSLGRHNTSCRCSRAHGYWPVLFWWDVSAHLVLHLGV